MTAAVVRNVEDAKLLALMLEGRDHEPNGGCFTDFPQQPLAASPAHTSLLPGAGVGLHWLYLLLSQTPGSLLYPGAAC